MSDENATDYQGPGRLTSALGRAAIPGALTEAARRNWWTEGNKLGKAATLALGIFTGASALLGWRSAGAAREQCADAAAQRNVALEEVSVLHAKVDALEKEAKWVAKTGKQPGAEAAASFAAREEHKTPAEGQSAVRG